MLNSAKVDSALRKLADSFLNNLRSVDSERSGWGQFVGQSSNQVGLYGTSAGIICVSLAYGPHRIPPSCVRWLESMWQSRNTPGDGSRNFSLTARRAFLLMALRLSQQPDLRKLIPDADKELLLRLVPDGLLVSWQIDADHRGATGNETVTGLAILAYVLSAIDAQLKIPPEIERAASALQARFEGALPQNLGLRKFMLTSISLGVRAEDLKGGIKKEVAKNRIAPETRDQDAIDWWDYYYSGAEGTLSKRDYLHAPSSAFDILLACSPGVNERRRRSGLQLAEEVAETVIDRGLYYDGRELAPSKTQAWIALALYKSKALIEETNDQQISMSRRFLNYFSRK